MLKSIKSIANSKTNINVLTVCLIMAQGLLLFIGFCVIAVMVMV